jgi:hypothetical protein
MDGRSWYFRRPLMSLLPILASAIHPAEFVMICLGLPRAILILRAGWIVLAPPPSGKLTPGRAQADSERRDRALAVLRTVCRFVWWRWPDR